MRLFTLKLSLLFAGLSICTWAATPAFVQQTTCTNTSPSAATLCTFSGNITPGNSIIVVLGHLSTRTISSISTATDLVAFTQCTTVQGTGIGVDIWNLHNYTGTTENQILIQSSAGAARTVANVSEWSGLSDSPCQSSNTNSGLLDANPATNSATPSSANNVAFGVGAWTADDYMSGPTNSYTRLTPAAATVTTAMEGAYLIQSSVLATSTGWTLSMGLNWATAIAVFGAPSAATPSRSLLLVGVN